MEAIAVLSLPVHISRKHFFTIFQLIREEMICWRKLDVLMLEITSNDAHGMVSMIAALVDISGIAMMAS